MHDCDSFRNFRARPNYNKLTSMEMGLFEEIRTHYLLGLFKTLVSKLDRTYTQRLRDIINNSWRQHAAKLYLCGLTPTILRGRRIQFTGNCWRAKQELESDLLLRNLAVVWDDLVLILTSYVIKLMTQNAALMTLFLPYAPIPPLYKRQISQFSDGYETFSE